MNEVVIVAAQRTAIGCFQGSLSQLPAVNLGSAAIRGAVAAAGIVAESIDEVLFGQVLSAGAGQSPARQASIGADIPNSVPTTTLNKVCGSGLKSVMLGAQAIRCGDAQAIIAGGMESMSQAPYLLPAARDGYRMGHKEVVDSMMHDGLFDPFGDALMGQHGDLCAAEHGFSRQQQDEFAIRSYQHAQQSQQEGRFAAEIVPVEVPARKKSITVDRDEEPERFLPEKIPNLRPAFNTTGTITAANASKLSDGAAAVVLMNRGEADRQGCTILASIVASAQHAQEPQWFTTAPIGAVEKALKKAKLSAGQIDRWEINEAFAVVPLAAIKHFELDLSRVNPRGGAIGLGHPLGCSGARVLVTLLHEMASRDVSHGCATLCIGGGEAVAMIVKRE